MNFYSKTISIAITSIYIVIASNNEIYYRYKEFAILKLWFDKLIIYVYIL